MINISHQFIQTHTAGFVGKIPSLIVVLCCASALFLLGLWDDKKKLGPFIKLVIEIIVIAFAAVFANVRLEFFIPNKIVTTILSVLWIAFIINAFNFLDNMDGACAGIATIVSLVLFAAAMASGQVFAGSMAIILAGALLGD